MKNPPVEVFGRNYIPISKNFPDAKKSQAALSLSWFIIIPSSWSLLSSRVTQPFSAFRGWRFRVTTQAFWRPQPGKTPWGPTMRTVKLKLQTPLWHPHQVVSCATHLLMTKVYNLYKFEMPWVSQSKRKHFKKKNHGSIAAKPAIEFLESPSSIAQRFPACESSASRSCAVSHRSGTLANCWKLVPLKDTPGNDPHDLVIAG